MANMQELENNGRYKTLYTYDNKVNFISEDPYGFWRISLDRGAVSKELAAQRFTTYSEALKAAEKYYAEKNEVLSPVPYVKPELQTKKTRIQGK